jgi:hypothetical protein
VGGAAWKHPVPYHIVAADFNSDHLWDIVVSDVSAFSVHVYLGYGNGTFAQDSSFSTDTFSPYSIASGDINNDNQLYLVVANSHGDNIGLFFSYGNGTLLQQMSTMTVGRISLLLIGTFRM